MARRWGLAVLAPSQPVLAMGELPVIHAVLWGVIQLSSNR